MSDMRRVLVAGGGVGPSRPRRGDGRGGCLCPRARHVARQYALRSVAHCGELLAQPDRPERFDRLTADTDAGADLSGRARLFEYLHLEAVGRERIRSREARKPPADDHDAAYLRHAFFPKRRRSGHPLSFSTSKLQVEKESVQVGSWQDKSL
jgi:hypothetical protein